MVLGTLRALRRALKPGAVMLAVSGEGDAIELATVMMPTDHMMLSYGRPAALGCLVAWMGNAGLSLPGIVGPRALAEACAARWEKRAVVSANPGLALDLYRLTDVVAPVSTSGELCQARETDLPWIVEWVREMFVAIRFKANKITENQALIADRVRRGEIFFWRHHGRPVAMAGFEVTAPGDNGGQVNMAYTPPDERGKGYISACVAGLCRKLLADDWDYCLIFADKKNPAAKKIYRRLGGHMVGSYLNFTFRARR